MNADSDPATPVTNTRDRPNWLHDPVYNHYSQHGEDGIIGNILKTLPACNHWCVEFGCWDGIHLSNTRYLLETQNYKGVLIEADARSFADLRRNNSENAAVTCIHASVGFGEDDKLDAILSPTQCPKDFDLLSVDIDGNDYHVWKAITAYKPKVVCIEFNPMIPNEVDYVQPADPATKHGASVCAIVGLGKEKGYEVVCINACNCFFVDAKYFPLFAIADNSIAALRLTDAPTVYVFPGYDGELIFTGDVALPWHQLRFRPADFQVVPWAIRRYPLDFNWFQKIYSAIYRLRRRSIFHLRKMLGLSN